MHAIAKIATLATLVALIGCENTTTSSQVETSTLDLGSTYLANGRDQGGSPACDVTAARADGLAISLEESPIPSFGLNQTVSAALCAPASPEMFDVFKLTGLAGDVKLDVAIEFVAPSQYANGVVVFYKGSSKGGFQSVDVDAVTGPLNFTITVPAGENSLYVRLVNEDNSVALTNMKVTFKQATVVAAHPNVTHLELDGAVALTQAPGGVGNILDIISWWLPIQGTADVCGTQTVISGRFYYALPVVSCDKVIFTPAAGGATIYDFSFRN